MQAQLQSLQVQPVAIKVQAGSARTAKRGGDRAHIQFWDHWERGMKQLSGYKK